MTFSKLFAGSADGNDTTLTAVNSNLGPIDRFFRTHYHHHSPHQFFPHQPPPRHSSFDPGNSHHAPNHDYSGGALYHPGIYGMYGPHQQFGLKLGHGGYDDSYSYGTSGGHMYYDHGPHYSGRKSGKGSGALSALTLLAFLFFLNLLQSCLKEHMDTMNPTVMVMTAGSGREQMEKVLDVEEERGMQGNATNVKEFSLREHFIELPKLYKLGENASKVNVYLKDYSAGG
ncbi:uncharacterized protein LOC132264855 [Phlebotomus argentipes]|uniref:uncharacterized protein LOC132264855 n=1 Tax=Phlebotomus argentipes TaxID=94469 RepID=UPI0028933A37|nr:uncharacterized protein LOC132264855 [Phlebotomus argentipes]